MLDLLRYFMTPDAHKSDPAGFIATQAGHFGAIGAPACWAVLALGAPPLAAVAIVAIGYAGVEAAQARFGGQTLADAATDWAFVTMGAIFLLGAATGSHIVAAGAILVSLLAALAGAAVRR